MKNNFTKDKNAQTTNHITEYEKEVLSYIIFVEKAKKNKMLIIRKK